MARKELLIQFNDPNTPEETAKAVGWLLAKQVAQKISSGWSSPETPTPLVSEDTSLFD